MLNIEELEWLEAFFDDYKPLAEELIELHKFAKKGGYNDLAIYSQQANEGLLKTLTWILDIHKQLLTSDKAVMSGDVPPIKLVERR